LAASSTEAAVVTAAPTIGVLRDDIIIGISKNEIYMKYCPYMLTGNDIYYRIV